MLQLASQRCQQSRFPVPAIELLTRANVVHNLWA